MSSISHRLVKLEREQLGDSIRKARSVEDMTDRELLRVILEGKGVEISDAEIDEQLPRFEATGEIPGMLGVTLDDVIAQGRDCGVLT